MRESVETKGRRYLVEGRLLVELVDGRRIVASCRGGRRYSLGYDPTRNEWRCTCPARGRCAHLLALRLIVRAP